ncbi:MAG: hypothetical protein COZ85_03565 [Candidatus Moranbacteria bacterium CG_4_8_14_3_um_filter_34_16]|nr:MAG: hypothetical protein COT31_01350 [Candidatus Moranbacteria bacterium CG08_land_8_20_14_0_20_34_16]PIW94739.1 MAG: hypothetical protein COZ85_03565 [Candidatus Moranbacteria bacterium CG_4_8_14_3_um_filter_34_16]PJA89339.1 MAG: hypothetical protein CO138_01025 [Candidatus Moranbacteria bacterium CG_4_9_14_3_um_filter_33_15]
MLYLIFALYFIVIISFILLYFFIIYHLSRYSVNTELKKIILPFFTIISALLLFSNIILFLSVDWKALFYQFF